MSKHGDTRKAAILSTGLALWRRDASSRPVSAQRIGKALGITHGAVMYHYGRAADLRDALAREAVRIGDPVIVPMLITAGHEAVAHMPAYERQSWLDGCVR